MEAADSVDGSKLIVQLHVYFTLSESLSSTHMRQLNAWESDRERERQSERDRETERERETEQIPWYETNSNADTDFGVLLSSSSRI